MRSDQPEPAASHFSHAMELDSDSDLPNTIGSSISITNKRKNKIVHGLSGQIPTTTACNNSNSLSHSDEIYPPCKRSSSSSADFVMLPKAPNYRRRRNTSLEVQALIAASQNLSHQNSLSLPNTNSSHSNHNNTTKTKPQKGNQHHITQVPSSRYKSRKKTRTRIEEPNQQRKRSKPITTNSISRSFGNNSTNSMQLSVYLYGFVCLCC